MAKISYASFLEIFNFVPYEPEFEIYFNHTEKTYMVIKYADKVSFQRCGCSDEMIENGCNADYQGTGEEFYNSFEELYATKALDGICLQDEWDNISVIILNSSFCIPDDIDDLKSVYMA